MREEMNAEPTLPLKADNDMESSDLGFSDDRNHADDHLY